MPLSRKLESPSKTNKSNVKFGTSSRSLKSAPQTKEPAKAATTVQQPAVPSAADDFAIPVREVLRPNNQLQLEESELAEEVPRTLTANNPEAPANLVRYSFRDRCYRAEPLIDQLLQHYRLEGCLALKGANAGVKEAIAASRRVTEVASRRVTELAGGTSVVDHNLEDSQLQLSCASIGNDGKKLLNQFNSIERGAQTGHGVPKNRSTMTEPPPTATASGSCSKWEIYDAYTEDRLLQKQQEELAKQRAAVARKGQQVQQRSHRGDAAAQQEQNEDCLQVSALPRAANVLERMVNQNIFNDLIMDFKYWDDPADDVRQQEGTLLPLWDFSSPTAKHRQVTALCWNPQYSDLFAVGYGSFDFQRPTTGVICCYTLKNPSAADATFTVPAGVMCLAFHPDHANLLVVGCYDGVVLIFDIRKRSGKPLYASSPKSGKHSEPVWQVSWQRTDSHELEFYSISTDGRVTLWTVSKNELSFQDVLQLTLLKSSDQENEDDNEQAPDIAGGTCFDFHPQQDYLFVVGTEEGLLYKCSTAYNSEYLETYKGHAMPVYAVRWNELHPRMFLSGGADWSVKLWDSLQSKPVMSFDLKSPVGDVAWAPFSSTTFAAVTEGGKAFVFDVSENIHRACCVQKVSKKAKLTKLAFNPVHPIMLVGDDRGSVVCLKLSPNLRKRQFQRGRAGGAAQQHHLSRSESQRKQEAAALQEEAGRLDKVLEVARKTLAQLDDM